MNKEENEALKISVPIITNQELEELDSLIENNYESIFEKISKTVSKDRDIIILKKIIEKQHKEIKELQELSISTKAVNQINKLQKECNEENKKCMLLAVENQSLKEKLKNSISKDKIKKDLETCEKVYEREMKPYQREYGLDVTYLSKKEKEKLINTRNCLITQMETYKQLLGGIEDE